MRTPWPAGILMLLAAALPSQQRPLPHALEPCPEWLAAITNGTRTADGHRGPQYWTDFAEYQLTAELMPDLARVQGQLRATYHNRSPQPLDRLELHLRQNLHAATAQRNVSVEITDGMQIDRLMLDGESATSETDGTVLTVNLPQPLQPGASTTLACDFAFTVPDGEAPRMGREGHDLYFLGQWYPQFAVHDDIHGWVAEQYLGESEFYMPYADYDVTFTVPVGWLVQATGELQNATDVLTEKEQKALAEAVASQKAVPIVTQQDLDQGTSTQPSKDDRLHWHFKAANVRDFAISTANCYLWDACSATVGDRDGDGTLDHCRIDALYRRHATTWHRTCRYAQHTIESMSAHVMPYPWSHASVVEGILGGGMEYPMLVLCGDQRVPSAVQSLTAHELCHQWFPMLVGSNEKEFGWQDEGLAEFFTAILEREFWLVKLPSKSMRAYDEIAAQRLDRERMLQHADHLVHPWSYEFLCYDKPCAVLQQLAGMVGEDAVVKALSEYAHEWHHAHPRPEDFFAGMNRWLGRDLDWYWSTWWMETWTLDHAIAEVRVRDDGSHSDVVVEDRGLAPHPAEVEVRFDDGETATQTVPVETWLGGARRATLTFAGKVVRAQLDAKNLTLDCNRENDTWKQAH